MTPPARRAPARTDIQPPLCSEPRGDSAVTSDNFRGDFISALPNRRAHRIRQTPAVAGPPPARPFQPSLKSQAMYNSEGLACSGLLIMTMNRMVPGSP
jgi:hypothetical protein